MRALPRLIGTLASLLLVAACSSTTDGPEGYTLKILHINDHHSRLAPTPAQTLNLAGTPTTVTFGGFPRVVSAFDTLSAGRNNVLKLHAGDAVTGDLYYTLFAGEADADLMNQVCFDAFALGNHEFDDGDAGLKRFLDFLNKPFWGCPRTPALAANVRPALGVSPLARFSATDYIQPSVVLEREGRRFGVIGIDIADKTRNSSRPDATTVFLDEVTSAQAEIDRLKAEGVKHIILLTHYGYANDRALARALSGVDVIVGGDSHSLLGTAYADLGLTPEGPYPTVEQNLDGDPVCIVQAWQYSWVVGELDVRFDPDGRVLECSGTPHLLLGDSFRRGNQDLDGADRAAVLAAIDARPDVSVVTPASRAQQVLDFYDQEITAFSAQPIGTSAERLCLRRVPGPYDRSRDATPGCADATDVQGGHIQQVVAEAFLQQGQRFGGADIAIQNAGGVRISVPEGTVTFGTAFQLLPFKNTLVRFTMTGAEVKAVLEDAVDFFVSNPGGNSGAFPYAARLRWDIDLSQAKGARIGNLAFRDADGTWAPIDLAASFSVIANDFIGEGRDGYLTFAGITGARKVDTFLLYTESFIEFVRSEGTLQRPDPADFSTQSFRDVDGTLFSLSP